MLIRAWNLPFSFSNLMLSVGISMATLTRAVLGGGVEVGCASMEAWTVPGSERGGARFEVLLGGIARRARRVVSRCSSRCGADGGAGDAREFDLDGVAASFGRLGGE